MDEKIVKDIVNDCISRQAAIHAICRDGVRLERGGALMITISTAKQWAVDLLGELPSAQPERKRGKWIKVNGKTAINCSACYHCSWSRSFEDTVKRFNFCPYCGADMRGVDDERPN